MLVKSTEITSAPEGVVLARSASGWGFKQRSEFLEALSQSLINYSALLTNVDDNILRQLNGNDGLVDAWEVLNIDDVLRKNPADLEKLSKFMKETGSDKAKLIESFKNTPDARKWVDMKIPQAELDNIYNGFKNDPPFDLDPWTPQHKAQRWDQYKARMAEEGKTPKTFETWSNRYDGNIEKANAATKATDDYFNSLKLDCPLPPCREVSLSVNGKTRRLDIADRSTGKAVEFKKYSESKVYKSKDIENEVLLDKALLEQGTMTEIEWVFKACEPSGPLRQLLESGTYPIKIKIIP